MVSALVGTRDTRRDFVSFAPRSDRRGGEFPPPAPEVLAAAVDISSVIEDRVLRVESAHCESALS